MVKATAKVWTGGVSDCYFTKCSQGLILSNRRENNRKEIFSQITETPVEMLPGFSKEASDLISGFLKIDPDERLGSSTTGAEEIKTHKFFQKVDWTKVYKRQISPPYQP
mmetsp:Transcript_815/g.798  ORF Transcript_815/g.798 Transcript_815/m.798 type:complete len:109 (+) Transcript_815:600-926(+)